MKIIGVIPSGSPAMWQALNDRPWDENKKPETTADGLAVRIPIQKITEEMKPFIDDLWLVKEKNILPALKSLKQYEISFANHLHQFVLLEYMKIDMI